MGGTVSSAWLFLFSVAWTSSTVISSGETISLVAISPTLGSGKGLAGKKEITKERRTEKIAM